MCRSFLPKKNQLPGRRTIARTESHGRTERWCLALSRVGYCNAALSPLFRSLSLHHFWCSHSAHPAARPPPSLILLLFPRVRHPRDHRRSCTSILCDSSFSIYFPRFAPRFPLQMSPRGRLTFALTTSSPSHIYIYIYISFSRSIWTPFSRPFDWRETLDHRLAINHSPLAFMLPSVFFVLFFFRFIVVTSRAANVRF